VTGDDYRLKAHATIAGKEEKKKKTKNQGDNLKLVKWQRAYIYYTSSKISD
jgi:hypothetical protein